MGDLEELKTILNSLVIPHPNGLSLRQLNYEYRDLEGDNIPFKKFGFHSVPALLKSMSNMVRMFGDPTDPYSLTLFPIRNEDTEHIIDLVQRQNKNSKGKKKKPSVGYNRFMFSRPSVRTANVHSNNRLSKSANTYRHNSVATQLMNNFSSTYGPVLSNNMFAKPLLPNPLQINLNNNGYNPKTVVDYTNKPTKTVTTKMTSLGDKFLNLRITKNLNKSNEQMSRIVQSRSATDLHSCHINNYSSPTPLTRDQTLPKLSFQQLKENIKLLLTSDDMEGGIMLFNFESRYKNHFKQPLDYKYYGFETLSDCFKTLSDVLELIPTGTNTYKVKPLVSQTVVNPTTTVITNGYSTAVITSTATTTTVTVVTTNSNQTTSTIISTLPKKSFTITSKKPADNHSVDSTKAQFQPMVNTTVQSQPMVSKIDSQPVTSNPINSDIMANSRPAVNGTKGSRSFDSFKVSSTTVESRPSESLFKPINSPKADDNESESSISEYINKRAKQNFRTILAFHEDGINALDFASEYEKHFKVEFDSRIWGFRTPMEMYCRLHNIFTIQENAQKEHILHDSRFKKFENPKPIQKTDSTQMYKLKEIPDEVKARILRLIKSADNMGLPIAQFSKIYALNYEPIEQILEKLRIHDSKELFDIVKNELPISISQMNGEDRAFIKSQTIVTDWIVRQSRVNKYIIPITLVDTPSSTVLPGESYRPIKLPEKFRPGNYEYVAAYISSAVNPQEIYIQFKGSDYHTALELLMYELDFYNSAPEDEWRVPYEFLYVGFPVVCRYPGDKNWHRARICRLHPNCKRVVTVSFVDYGGTAIIDYKQLRLMRKQFLYLPVQALKVGLYGIRPINGRKVSDWTTSARDKVLAFSQPQYALAVTLIEVTPENHWVAICDTNGNEDVFLHIVLVNEKQALEIDD